jgi:hypothetical protein
MIQEAMNASRTLNGKAMRSNRGGKTFKFQITTHMSTKPINQDKKVVSRSENFLEIIYIAPAKRKDHTPHIAPFMGSEGNVNPRDS